MLGAEDQAGAQLSAAEATCEHQYLAPAGGPVYMLSGHGGAGVRASFEREHPPSADMAPAMADARRWGYASMAAPVVMQICV